MAIQTELDKLSDGITTSVDALPIESSLNPGDNIVEEVNQQEKNLDALPKNDGIQLAMGKPIKDIIVEATEEATKRIYGNQVQKDFVVDLGDSLVIRPADEIDLKEFDVLLKEGDDKSPGINFFDLGKELTSDKSMKAIFAFDQFEQNLSTFLEKVKEANAPLFKQLSRGPLSVEAMKKLAEKNGLRNVTMKMLSRKPGEVLPAEDTVGALIAMVNLGKLADRHVRKALETGDMKDKIIAHRFIALQSKLSASISGNVSEYARGMSAVRWASKISESGDLSSYAKELDDIVATFKDTENMDTLLQMYVSLPKGQRLEFAKKSLTTKTMDALVEVYINSLLSSPVTHFVNIAGNSMFQLLKVLETFPASAVGALRTSLPGQSRLHGNPNDRVFLKESFYKAHGIQMALKDAFLLAGKTFVTEQPGIRATKIDVRNQRAIGNTGDLTEIFKWKGKGHIVPSVVDMLGVYYRMPSRFLITEDEFFRVIAMRSKTYSEAIRRSEMAYNDALKATGGDVKTAERLAGIEYNKALDNPDTSVIEDYGKELTFTADLEGILASGQSFTSNPFIKFFIPFYRTPANLFTEAFDRTLPFNVYRKVKNGTGREVDEATAKLISGWGIGFAWYMLASEHCDGSGPDDVRAKKAWLRNNNQPYSCSVEMDDGSEKSFTFSRMDPVSPILAMASDLNYYLQNEPDQEKVQFMLKVFTLAVTDYADQHPMLQGGHEIFNILSPSSPMSSSARFDRAMELIGEKAGSVLLASSPVPTFANPFYPSSSSFSAWLERQSDPTASNVMLPEGEAQDIFGNDIGLYTDLSPAVRGFYIALQKAKSRNPLWNKDLEPALNMWGEVRMQSEGLSRWEYWSPIRIKEKKYNMVDEELVKLGNAGAGGISMPKKKLSNVLLNAKEYNRYIYLMNEVDVDGNLPGDSGYDESSTLLNTLMDIISGTSDLDKGGENLSDLYYDALLPEDQMNILNYVVSNRKQSARKHLISEYDRLQFHFPIED